MTTSATAAIWPAPSPEPSPMIERPRQEPRRWRVRRAVTAVLVAGVAGAAIGVDRPVTSVGAVLVIVVAAMMTARASLLPRTGRFVVAIAVVGFVPWLVIRSSPWLIVPDVMAALVLAGLALSTRNGAGITDSLGGYLRRCVRALAGCIETPAHVHLGLRTTMPSDRRAVLVRSVGPLALGVVAAGATFVSIVALRPTLRSVSRRDRAVILALGGVAAGCTMAMAGAAIVKLQLYADVFGLTMLRLHTTVFAAWLMVAIAIAFVSLVRPSGEWVVPVVAATALCGVFAMNIVNPEQVVAEHNLSNTITNEEFDLDYLISLSDDAVPTIVEQADRLTVTDRERLLVALCAVPRDRAGALDWNWSRSDAERARASVC